MNAGEMILDFNAIAALSTTLTASTKAVVASCNVFVLGAAVGAVGIPVSTGAARLALSAMASSITTLVAATNAVVAS